MEKETLSKKQLKLSVLIENCINFNVLLFNEVKVKHINLEKENIKKIKEDIIKNNKNCLNNLIHYETSLMSSNVIDLVLECYREIQIIFIRVLNSQNLLFIQAAIENGKLFYQFPISLQRDYILYLIFNRYKQGKTSVSRNEEEIIKRYNFEINYLFEFQHFCKLMLIYAYQWSIENKELSMTKKICHYREIVKSVVFLNACEKGDKKFIRKYLNDNLVNINIISKLGKTPLDMAILKFNQDLVDLFLAQEKLDINYRGLCGNTALMTAVECGNYEAMKSLLEHKNIDINLSNDYGGTALMYATSNAVDNKENVHILVTKPDINLNLKDENEETAFLLSIKCKNIKIAKYLVKQKQIDINSKNIFGDCPLLLAIEYPNMHPLVDDLLCRKDIDVNIQNKNLSTPLMLAIQNNYEDIVKKLLSHPNININLKDSDEETALSISLKHGFFYLSRIILQHPDLQKDEKENFFKCLSSSTLSQYNTLPILNKIETASLIKYWFECKSDRDFQLGSWLNNYSEEKTKKIFYDIFKHDKPLNLFTSPPTHEITKFNGNNNNNNNINSNIINLVSKKDNIHKNIKTQDDISKFNSNKIICNLYHLKTLKLKIQEYIIEKILNTQNSYGYSMLMILVSVNDIENIKKLLKYPFLNINLQDRYGETALIKAVNNDKSDLVELLMNSYHPNKPSNRSFTNDTPSISINENSNGTVTLNKEDIMKLENISKEINIIRNGDTSNWKHYIDTSLKDNNGYNAKKIAYIYGNKEIENLIDNYNKLIIGN